jgi:hypothetical protein
MVDDQPTRLWKLTKDGRSTTCQVRLVPYGIEVDILRDDVLLVTRTFAEGDEALAWADDKRAARAADGWRA